MKQQEVQTIATDVRAIRCTNSMITLALSSDSCTKKEEECTRACLPFVHERKKMIEKLWQQQCCCYWVCIRLLISD